MLYYGTRTGEFYRRLALGVIAEMLARVVGGERTSTEFLEEVVL